MKPFSWQWAVPSLARLGLKVDLIERSIRRGQGDRDLGPTHRRGALLDLSLRQSYLHQNP